MAGIYLHFPFCKQACHYCNFHFVTSLRGKDALLAALHREIERQSGYLGGADIETVYFGGGTPSLLTDAEINGLFEALHRYHRIREDAEVTLEANPDDLNTAYLKALRGTPVNRLSIGIQSFSDADLRYMNRAHNADEAANCVFLAQDAGFDNLTVDLIYGTPTMSHVQWAHNLRRVFEMQVPHLSCYCLTVEPKTPLDKSVKKGTTPAVNDDDAAQQMHFLMDSAREAGYEHYEISNFALPGFYAKHNSNYWFGVPYLGLGPAAHSFDGSSRQWNVANNAQYVRGIEAGNPAFEVEHLTAAQRYNEYVMTSLRTMWGCQLQAVEAFGGTFSEHFYRQVLPFVASGQVSASRSRYALTDEGRLMADHIAAELFWVDET